MTSPGPPPAPPRVRRGRVLFWFAALLVGVDFVALAFEDTWKRHSPDEYALRVEECARAPRDAVFVGGSPVAEGVDPEIVGPLMWHAREMGTGYNLGLAGGTASDVYFAARHACPTAPKLLVYGCTASDFNDSRHEPHGVQSVMTWSDVQDWRRTRPEAAEWVTRHYAKGELAKASALYRYRFGIRMWAAGECDNLSPGSCPESATEARRQRDLHDALHRGIGFAPTEYFAHRRYDHMKRDGWVAPPFAFLANYKTGSHLKYLHRLIEWAEEGDTEILLIDMPVTADLEARHPAEFAEYRKRLVEIGRTRGVTILNGRDAELNDAHFADLIHMNCSGTAEFSVWLRTTLGKFGEAERPHQTLPHGRAWAEMPR